ncbi:leucyl aminopeptidase [Salinibacterium sp. ZJ70]|uniref:leucyl aminopeptidase n=1 Tax=Salinibacterium sp. ZJ70 TaxID=2708084 RepID=UPI001422A97D|nr:leucyl aminopeptidase [Salinibacterium sp. ZJ70]
MAVPALATSSASVLTSDADLLVVGVIRGADGPELPAGIDLPELAALLPAIGVTGSLDEFKRAPAVDGAPAPFALIGLGSTPDRASIRSAAGAAARLASGIGSIALALPVADANEAEAALSAAGAGAYSFTAYRTASDIKLPPASITLHVPSDIDVDGVAARATSLATALASVRDLVNAPPADLYPETFVEQALALAEGLPVDIEVLTESDLADGGFGGILGVGRGSVRPPRLAVVRYSPDASAAHLAIVGKGITFDSGGLSLKPPSSMPTMKYDMTGAATALVTVLEAARRQLPLQVTAWLCLAENMPSGAATRPGDVLRMWNGSTVEVTNTDAEGRLVLADGLASAAAEKPDLIVDVATLTGAAKIAMGERTTAVMGDDAAVELVIGASRRADEPMWPMPMPAELRSVLDSDIADIANAKPGNTAGGMLVAAHFLRAFVGTTGSEGPGARIGWAHLDIASAAYNSGAPYGAIGRGPTGVSVRTLLELAESLARDAEAAEPTSA